MTATPVVPGPGATLYFRWALFNILLAVGATVAMLWIYKTEQRLIAQAGEEEERRTRECERPVIRSAEPPVVDPDVAGPPQDKPKTGYVGASGVDISPAMELMLEVVRDPSQEQTGTIRLGSQEALPSRTIHVINLWATWCEPCRDEMPDFKAMFARRRDWGDSVRFVPIQLKDPTSPTQAYKDLGSSLPVAPVKLADRGYGDPLAKLLSGSLFRGNLPVTLVLDCNRRVRWAQFEQLSSLDFTEIEGFIDQFVKEVDDTSDGSWCTQEWAGNGRCEARERVPGSHVLADCGELKKRVEVVGTDPTAETPPPLPPSTPQPEPKECPEGQILAKGKCQKKAKLLGVTGVKVAPATCGDKLCSTEENEKNCCDCLQCEAPLVCRLSSNGEPACLVKGLK